ncbi:Uncharacterised protein [Bordetella pertussis]|nr:Uncharacterised protein [Bordetella pertussis]
MGSASTGCRAAGRAGCAAKRCSQTRSLTATWLSVPSSEPK